MLVAPPERATETVAWEVLGYELIPFEVWPVPHMPEGTANADWLLPEESAAVVPVPSLKPYSATSATTHLLYEVRA